MNDWCYQLKYFYLLCIVIGFSNPLVSKQIQFSLVPDRDDIIQYEIELWKTENLEQEIPFRVLSNPGPINLFIPDGYEYFRIRAVAKRKVRGYWTELYQTGQFGKSVKTKEKPIAKVQAKTDVLVPIPTREGASEFYLTTNKIAIVPVTIGKNFRIKYRINGGPWQKDSSPQLNFEKDGSYRLEYQVTNELGVSDGMQVWEFKVDTTPPESSIRFLNPPFFQRGTSFISPKNPLQVFATDTGSGINTIRYRTSCKGAPFTEYYVWNDSSWADIQRNCLDNFRLEISAVDRLGNEEIPKQILFQKMKQD
ncbi:MAG: LBF_2017 N-terminal domain-containing protein [Leptospira bouyouniensis]|uniref:Ig-like domain-containing protein n=1 Tax=Leptospira bouyouniensis TaxID=2484911 RepID=A0ABY2L370_9LEPT|nr:hypothetical protein [Leptospira bouyouniensis]TGK48377.1 hypothetical protein EHQ10_11665 [Leptospira bouyouniensis]